MAAIRVAQPSRMGLLARLLDIKLLHHLRGGRAGRRILRACTTDVPPKVAPHIKVIGDWRW